MFVGGGGGGGGGVGIFFFFFFAEETGRVKNYLGECNLRVTRQVGECSEMLVSNPVILSLYVCLSVDNLYYHSIHFSLSCQEPNT